MTGVTRSRSVVLPMAGDAISHIQSAGLKDSLHGFYRSVAGLTFYAFGHMLLMAEVNKIWHVVDPNPLDRTTGFVFLAKFYHLSLACGHYVVASHADVHGRNGCMGGAFGMSVAVQTGNLVVSGVDFVAKRDRLDW